MSVRLRKNAIGTRSVSFLVNLEADPVNKKAVFGKGTVWLRKSADRDIEADTWIFRSIGEVPKVILFLLKNNGITVKEPPKQPQSRNIEQKGIFIN